MWSLSHSTTASLSSEHRPLRSHRAKSCQPLGSEPDGMQGTGLAPGFLLSRQDPGLLSMTVPSRSLLWVLQRPFIPGTAPLLGPACAPRGATRPLSQMLRHLIAHPGPCSPLVSPWDSGSASLLVLTLNVVLGGVVWVSTALAENWASSELSGLNRVSHLHRHLTSTCPGTCLPLSLSGSGIGQCAGWSPGFHGAAALRLLRFLPTVPRGRHAFPGTLAAQLGPPHSGHTATLLLGASLSVLSRHPTPILATVSSLSTFRFS